MWDVVMAAANSDAGTVATGGGAIGTFLVIAVVRGLYNATPRRRAQIARQRAQRAAWNTYRQNMKAWELQQKRMRQGR